jgi:hypothetical protein
MTVMMTVASTAVAGGGYLFHFSARCVTVYKPGELYGEIVTSARFYMGKNILSHSDEQSKMKRISAQIACVRLHEYIVTI